MQQGRWKDQFVMEMSLFHETLDELVKFVTDRVESEPTVEVPPFVVVASPSDNDSEHPDMSFWMIMDGFNRDTKYPMINALGRKVGEQGITMSAVFMVSESWMISVKEKNQLPTNGVNLEDVPGRIEIISLVGMDIERNFANVIIHIDRQPDNNAIIIKETEKNYPLPGDTKSDVKSDLIEIFMQGYVNGIHVAHYGVEIDPKNPLKYIKPRQGAKI